jgi:hypothetical protein
VFISNPQPAKAQALLKEPHAARNCLRKKALRKQQGNEALKHALQELKQANEALTRALKAATKEQHAARRHCC